MPADIPRPIDGDRHVSLRRFGKRSHWRALCSGDKQTWDAFVAAAAPLVHAVVRRVAMTNGLDDDVIPDAVQHVFVRLCAGECGMLKAYDPARATMATWLAVTSWSSAAPFLRDNLPIGVGKDC
jgi:hypothetical protein